MKRREPDQLDAFLQANGVQFAIAPGCPDSEITDEWKEGFRWTATFTTAQGKWSLPFFTGSGWIYSERDNTAMGRIMDGRPIKPLASDVFSCIYSDSRDFWTDRPESFEEWAGNLGYDPDSRKAERIYKTCQQQAKRAREVFGALLDSPELETIMENY